LLHARKLYYCSVANQKTFLTILLDMARTKKQTVKKFFGRRKRTNMRRNISVVSEHLSRATEDPVVGTEASPVSASSSKLGYFGITLQALDSNVKMEDGKDNDFYIIV